MNESEIDESDVDLAETLADALFVKGFTHRSRDQVAKWIIELGYRPESEADS